MIVYRVLSVAYRSLFVVRSLWFVGEFGLSFFGVCCLLFVVCRVRWLFVVCCVSWCIVVCCCSLVVVGCCLNVCCLSICVACSLLFVV